MQCLGVLGLVAWLAGCAATTSRAPLPGRAAEGRLRLATWNIEYLVEPATYAALKDECVADGGRVPGHERRLPCAIVPRLDRDADDFAALARYAQVLDADVLALHEVDGPGAAGLFLSGYDYCFTQQPHVQKNGLAIRQGIPFRCEGDYTPLSLGGRFLDGLVVTLFPGEQREMTLLAMRLKSGCPDGPLTDPANVQCESLARQIPALEAWIDAQARAGRRFAVLGDFNRRLAVERGPARDGAGRQLNLWPEIDDGDPPDARLTDVTRDAPFLKCIPNDPFDAYVDFVVLGRRLARDIVPGSFQRVTFTLADATRYGLSDHCPVGIELRLR